MDKYLDKALFYVNQMQPKHWLFLVIGMIVVGLVCMKGTATRSHY